MIGIKATTHTRYPYKFRKMKNTFCLLLWVALASCSSKNSNDRIIEQTELANAKIKDHVFLECMYQDSYFPKFLVDKCKNILLELCLEIEMKKPDNLKELYKLTHSATNKLNGLQNEFLEHDSEIETGARECLAMDFEFISKAYGFEADVEELIATREW